VSLTLLCCAFAALCVHCHKHTHYTHNRAAEIADLKQELREEKTSNKNLRLMLRVQTTASDRLHAQRELQHRAALAYLSSQRLAESPAAEWLAHAYEGMRFLYLSPAAQAQCALVHAQLLTIAGGIDGSDILMALPLLAAVKEAAAAESAALAAAAAAAEAETAAAAAAAGDEHAHHVRRSSGGLHAIGGALLGVTAGVASTVSGVVNMLPSDAAKAVHNAAEATAEAIMSGARRANSGEYLNVYTSTLSQLISILDYCHVLLSVACIAVLPCYTKRVQCTACLNCSSSVYTTH
jgi:cell division septum initiation protein DivIVA